MRTVSRANLAGERPGPAGSSTEPSPSAGPRRGSGSSRPDIASRASSRESQAAASPGGNCCFQLCTGRWCRRFGRRFAKCPRRPGRGTATSRSRAGRGIAPLGSGIRRHLEVEGRSHTGNRCDGGGLQVDSQESRTRSSSDMFCQFTNPKPPGKVGTDSTDNLVTSDAVAYFAPHAPCALLNS